LTFNGNFAIVEGLEFIGGVTVNQDHFSVIGINSWMVRCKGTVRGTLSAINFVQCDFDIDSTIGVVVLAGGNLEPSLMAFNRFRCVTGSSSYAYMCSPDLYDRTINVIGNTFIGNNITGQFCLALYRSSFSEGAFITQNRFYNFENGITNSVGFDPNSQGDHVYIYENIFDTMSGTAIHTPNTPVGYMSLIKNYYYNCTTAFTTYPIESEILSNDSLSGSPFVATATDDFSLNDTAGAGAVLRAAGFPISELMNWATLQKNATYAAGGGSSRPLHALSTPQAIG